MEEITISQELIKCYVCKENNAKYTCPKCGCRYCCLNCYTKHGNACTENFYKENVNEYLQSQVADEDVRQKTLDMLKRLSIEDEEEENFEREAKELERIEIILEKIKKGDKVDEIWAHFTDDEKRDFENNITQLYAKETNSLTPWYHSNDSIPPLPQNITPFSKLMGNANAPSPNIHLHLFNILFSYCYTYRLYEGDWKEDIAEFVNTLITLSPVLNPNPPNDNFRYVQGSDDAVHITFLHSSTQQFSNPLIFSIECLNDTKTILSNRDFVLSALNHLISIFRSFQSFLKTQTHNQSNDQYHKIAFRVKKKLEFFLSWFDEVPIGFPLIIQLIDSSSSYYDQQLFILKHNPHQKPSDLLDSSDFSSRLIIKTTQ